MSWSRRQFLVVAGASALPACGFTPVYGPTGQAGRLLGQIALPAPRTEDMFSFVQRFEERLGRAPAGAPYMLDLVLETSQQDLGRTSAGEITRYRVTGQANYTLLGEAEVELLSSQTAAFTGYSATGSSVATLAGERDARDRLMIILADQVVDALLIAAADLPA